MIIEQEHSNSGNEVNTWHLLVASGIFSCVGALALNILFPQWQLIHYPLHAVMEGIGSLAAFTVAALILSLRRHNYLSPAYTMIAAALFGMGFLDGLHALIHAGNQFVWLHSMATFIGGVTFIFVWSANRLESARWFSYTPAIVLAISCFIGIVSLTFPENLPTMVVDKQFTLWARLLNIIGGIGFLSAAFYFVLSKRKESNQSRVIFSTHCILFGLSGIIFEFSVIWDAAWWFWHLLRVCAYMIALIFYLNLTRRIFRELHNLKLSLVEEKNKAEAENRAKSTFLANMSHEIRTPMNGIIGASEILCNMNLQHQQERMVQTIRNSSMSLLRIIDDILDVSKIEAGRLHIETASLNLSEVAGNTIDTLRLSADEQNVRLSFILDPRLPDFILSDSVRLHQILMNLLGNAVKFSRREEDAERPGFVKLQVKRLNDTQMSITVSDNGIGLSEDMLTKLFQPFTQADESTTRQFGGTGLGLVITKNLVRLMGGSIDVVSTLDEGSIFTVTLPFIETKGKNNDPGPDISGLMLLALIDDNVSREEITACIEHDGGSIRFFEDETELALAVSTAANESIILLGLQTMTDNFRVHQLLSVDLEQNCFICFANSKTYNQDCVLPDCHIVQGYPVLPSELKRGLSILSGQMCPEFKYEKIEPDVSNPDIKGDHIHRILLVEDNEVNQMIIEYQLQMLNHNVQIAQNGVEGLEKWKTGEFDLVLADCNMPIMDGFQMTEALRELENKHASSRTPIIAITANALQGESERCLAAGMDAYLSKPVKFEDLKKILETWLRPDSVLGFKKSI